MTTTDDPLAPASAQFPLARPAHNMNDTDAILSRLWRSRTPSPVTAGATRAASTAALPWSPSPQLRRQLAALKETGRGLTRLARRSRRRRRLRRSWTSTPSATYLEERSG